MAKQKRTGRPLKEHPPGTTAVISLQVPAELKSRLQALAVESGRTLSQETLWRLERSLDPSALWNDAFMGLAEKAYAEGRQKRRRHEIEAMGHALRSLAKELGERIEEFESRPKGKADE